MSLVDRLASRLLDPLGLARLRRSAPAGFVVDLNADLGEGAGHDDELLALVTSANIACGFHAGDAETMRRSIETARDRKVAVGAHPSLFDRENFGRKELPVKSGEVFDAVVYQLGIFQAIAEAAGVQPNHVKPHGALYNMAVRDQELADAIGRAIAKVDIRLILFAPQSSALARAGITNGLLIAHEVFADRNYLSDGSLVPRSRPDALLHDPEEAATRVVRMLREAKVHSVDGVDVDVRAETVCVHGDTPGAVDFARSLKSRLESEGVSIRAPKFSK
jgi:5-oxoprolinase (ATP-hydrolysing) subunit A